ncbi:MAG: hypothetical protein LW692_02535 [Sphingobacteriales bacterium]|nr:hypothetical protein [Sphingobacteriales bacterium]
MAGVNKIAAIFSLLMPFGFPAFGQTDSALIDAANRDNITQLQNPASSQRQIITAEQIRLSGYSRLSDILQLADAWTFSSINGDRWYMQSNGTSAYGNQNWILMVNGQRVIVNTFDAAHINTLGIPVHDIERIEIINTPILYLNEYADKGLIHIITKKMPSGFFYKAFINQGNVTGDPGPYRYLNSNLYNIDKIGLNYAHTAGYANKQLQCKINYTYQDYFARSQQVGNRFLATNNPGLTTKSNLLGIRPELSYAGKNWYHQLNGYYTRAAEFDFFMPLATELYKEQNYYQAGYLVEYRKNAAHRFRLSLSVNGQLNDTNALGRPGYEIRNTQLVLLNFTHSYQFIKRKKAALWKNGIAASLNQFEYITNKQFEQTLIKPYSSLHLPISRKAMLNTDAEVVVGRFNEGFKVTTGIYKRVDLITNWNLILGYSQRISEEELIPVLSTNILLSNFGSGGIFTNIQQVLPKQFTTDFYYGLTIGNNVRLTYNIAYKNIWDQLQLIQYANLTLPHYSSSTIGTGAGMSNLINRINLYYNVVDNVVMYLNYMRTGNITGDEMLALSIPKNKLSLILESNLPKQLKVWNRWYYQSETQWMRTTPAGDAIMQKMPKLFLCDVGVSKSVFKNKLQLNATLRNVFNQDEIYHPAGANIGLRMFVSAVFQLEGIQPKRKQ